jgi:uncharacterized protein YdhG (YjbR/CyaY superfamily)
MKNFTSVDEYIARAPKAMQRQLRELRALIKEVAPEASERISYGMPFYEYKGRLVYFASMTGYIGLYIPPPIIANHAEELKAYKTTKSAIHLPADTIPATLVRKLIRARMKHNAGATLRKRAKT